MNMDIINQLNLVPTVVPDMKKLMNEFINLKFKNLNLSEKEFQEKMFSNNKISLKKSTRRSYCTPFKKNEFNLFEESLDSIKSLNSDSYKWLKNKNKLGFMFTDDRTNIYLKGVWIVGYLNKYYSGSDFNSILISANIAGNIKAAQNLVQVSITTGRYFKFIDKKGRPLKNYYDFYCNDMSLLENRILDTIKKVTVYMR
jgi:hypothetical protein